ncbi:WD40 repeat-containing protein [Rivularia sp. PCC 7116]|uniref:serine/threonine-protein kinase n=1 Tax=Rivularia sp. PCC 7116 TaxID=373994 RepID=UPI00029EDE70|nr:serine/threonine-protein kinase [Rivularia sp. PCC 7116]AFY56262.1 WD40 repeat-containing protein [Rivularia sp. PCC 7116]
MSYCLNPHCQKPQNQKNANSCLTCGTQLLLKQRYRAIKPIGQGGFGRTLLAVDESKLLKPPCVIKQFLMMAQGTDNSQKAAALFEQEALRLNELGKHNQIPNLLDYLTQEEHQYLVQEYIDGYDLAEILKEQGTFKEDQIWELLNSLLPVLEFIHSRDVIHRDIKPENIIRSRDGKLCLVDFGAAKVVTGTAILQTGTSIGTPEFVAPEQSRGKAIYSSDLYSLGTTCIYLLTGVSPFDLFDISEYTWIWRQYLVENPVSDKLSNILDKLIENATSRRYQSATEILKTISPLQTTYINQSQLPNQRLPITFKNQNRHNKVVAVENKQYANTAKRPSPSNDKKLNYVWKCIHTLNHHAASISSIAISPNGNILVSASSYCAIKLWNINTSKSVRTFCCDYPIKTVAFSPNGLYIASGDSANNIIIWDVSSCSKRFAIKGHTDAGVNCLSFSPDGQIIVSAGSDKTIKLWNINTGNIIRTLKAHKKSVNSVAISPNGKLIASGGADRTARIWNLKTAKMLNTLDTDSKVNSVAFSPDGGIIATGGEAYNIKLWEVISGKEICTLDSLNWAKDGVFSAFSVKCLTFSLNGEILATNSYNNDIKLWNVNTKQEIHTLKGHSAKVNSIAFSPDERFLYSGSDDSTIKIWRWE